MNRSFKDYAVSGVTSSRSLFPLTASNHRRGNSLSRDSDDRTLDLFSNNRCSISLSSPDDLPDDRTVSLKLGKISVGSAKTAKNGSEDLLTNADGGKHDYDWLLTPPETPLFQERNEFQHSFTAPKASSAARSTSTTKSSRPSTNHVESNATSRPTRSSSVTRSSVSYSHNNSYSSIRSSSNILNTSSASVSSYIRPSSPITRSSTITRPSTPSRTATQSRTPTPSKARSRPSTPNSRAQITPNLTPSRSSTPTRRTTISTSSPNPNLSAPTVRALSNGRTHTSASRPSSPSPRVRQQSSDFDNTPSNLRTSLPDRPVSVGRSRPNPLVTAKVNTESQGNGSFSRRASSPVVTRGRSVEPKGRSTNGYSNGYTSEAQEPRKLPYVADSPSRKNLRASTTADSNGFGRSISKKSLDMAIKHMDIRNSPGNTRPHAGTVLYPQSIRSGASKLHPTPSDPNGRLTVNNENTLTPEKPKYNTSYNAVENMKREENGGVLGRLREVDIFESSRYDAILLKEDLKNTNWLLSSDEKSDQGLLFDHGFESLPEPFGLS